MMVINEDRLEKFKQKRQERLQQSQIINRMYDKPQPQENDQSIHQINLNDLIYKKQKLSHYCDILNLRQTQQQNKMRKTLSVSDVQQSIEQLQGTTTQNQTLYNTISTINPKQSELQQSSYKDIQQLLNQQNNSNYKYKQPIEEEENITVEVISNSQENYQEVPVNIQYQSKINASIFNQPPQQQTNTTQLQNNKNKYNNEKQENNVQYSKNNIFLQKIIERQTKPIQKQSSLTELHSSKQLQIESTKERKIQFSLVNRLQNIEDQVILDFCQNQKEPVKFIDQDIFQHNYRTYDKIESIQETHFQIIETPDLNERQMPILQSKDRNVNVKAFGYQHMRKLINDFQMIKKDVVYHQLKNRKEEQILYCTDKEIDQFLQRNTQHYEQKMMQNLQ